MALVLIVLGLAMLVVGLILGFLCLRGGELEPLFLVGIVLILGFLFLQHGLRSVGVPLLG